MPGSNWEERCSSVTPCSTGASRCVPASSTSEPPWPTSRAFRTGWPASAERWTRCCARRAGCRSRAVNPDAARGAIRSTVLLLLCSNVFMTFAWYAHLGSWPIVRGRIAALVSWGIALFEYLLQVPANRIGYTALSLAQLKILQEVITLSVFVPFACSTCGSRSGSTTSGPPRACWAPCTSFSARRMRALLAGMLRALRPAGWPRRPGPERARDLGIPLDGTPGPLDAITDVAGVRSGMPPSSGARGRSGRQGPVRTGVTAIFPRGQRRPGPGVRRLVQPQRQRRDDRHGLDRRLRPPALPRRCSPTPTASATVRDAVIEWGGPGSLTTRSTAACRSWPRPGTAS